MELREIADAIGIGTYDPELDAVYAALPQADAPACDLTLIDRLQADWNFFGEFYDLVRDTAIRINNDENRSTWVKTAVAYAMDRTVAEANKVPAPKADGTAVTALLPLYILLPLASAAIADYCRRGFSKEEISRLMGRFSDGLRSAESKTGIPGISKGEYNWLMLFAKARIFIAHQLLMELNQSPKHVVYIKHKTTCQLLPIMYNAVVHRSGCNLLGSVGYEDEAGAFEAVFREDDENFYGHACFDCKIDTEEKTFSKTEWEVYLRPGDDCLKMHIPKGADISEEAMRRSFALGRQIARERYPEHKGQAIYMFSWILDPRLEDIMGPDTKIVKLLKLFEKYPLKNDGLQVFNFVFGGKPTNLEELPEKSTLQRGLKKLFLEGGHNHPHAGIVKE